MGFRGLEFRVLGFGGLGLWGFGFRDLEFRVLGFGPGFNGFGLRALGLELRAYLNPKEPTSLRTYIKKSITRKKGRFFRVQVES